MPRILPLSDQDDGIFTTIDVPGANSTEAFGINDDGTVVGDYNRGHGFIATQVSEPHRGERVF